jgi:hypothetical protein
MAKVSYAGADGKSWDVDVVPAQLAPAKDWIKPVEAFVPTGSMTSALKVARARANVAVDAQPQLILMDPTNGALFVCGTAVSTGPDAGKVAAIDGAALPKTLKSVSATKMIEDVQAIVGADSWIDFSKGTTAPVTAFAPAK